MVFDGILGQDTALKTLTRALESGHVHHAYRFEGPDGVGKELAAMAFAQSLLCSSDGPIGCGQCSACQRVVKMTEAEPHVPSHPDVVLIQRALYPPSLLGTTTRETSSIGVEQIRRIVLSRAGFSPHEGRALVFIIRDAHELTAQAANALLKTLEEPGPLVHFILITSQPNRLLDTIRSRTLPVRFAPLSDDHIKRILGENGKPLDAALLAQGSASTALALADEETLRAHEDFVSGAMAAVDAPHPAGAVTFAASKPADRDALRKQLFFLAQRVAHDTRALTLQESGDAPRAACRYRVVLEAIDHLERNGQPALVLEAMIAGMRAA